ncbi:hypothetical protein K470DRAFT_260585 [Piedraia hortae CBS 480.64]|uniref:DUF3074 domain-containing protein n=1 Tax=Piedraia hortae CBS 480.64 TaxID=1314780 RepID=A0A6A7BT10_9PEZI|nr:hypothetical protein K470DRAFT_260585 [Piedraia hortae CBS 480.64]
MVSSDIHNALKQLSFVKWSDVPQDDLPDFLSSAFAAGELICNSVPHPPKGQPFHEAQPRCHEANTAKCAADVLPSSARQHPPAPEHEALQKQWGRPIKLSGKEIPQEVALFKMAGNDRHGAWFARRSVHEGIGFDKFHHALRYEFDQSLAVHGDVGAGAIRGLAGDQRLERVPVEGIGTMEVYQLSALMPRPVSAREFVTLLLTTDHGLSEKSGIKLPDSSKKIPRHYMMVSRPTEHPDAPSRQGFVRGQYESVELIREIPLHLAKSQEAEEGINHELNPVEWIMVTRSDPGGGIPRFLIDRGTPEAMLGDVTKFLDWACNQSIEPVHGSANGTKASDEQEPGGDEPSGSDKKAQFTPGSRVMGNSLLGETPGHRARSPQSQDSSEKRTSSDDEDSSSTDSFLSADEMRRQSTRGEEVSRLAQQSTPSIASNPSSMNHSMSGSEYNKAANSHDKVRAKINQQRERLERKMAQKMTDGNERLQRSKRQGQTEHDKVRKKHEADMKKAQEKHQRELDKLDRKMKKEVRKADQRQRKREEQSKISLLIRERDEFRSQLDVYKKENKILIERLGEVQRENTALVVRLRALGDGIEDPPGKTQPVKTENAKPDDSSRV